MQMIERLLQLKMKWHYFYRVVPIAFIALVLLMILRGALLAKPDAPQAAHQDTQPVATSTSRTKASSAATAAKPTAAIDWRKPSEQRAYPSIAAHPNLEFDVDTAKQRVYLRDQGTTLYTMYVSTGMADSTPKGTFAIQSERGYSFYNGREKMGAHYYTSWLDHGKYLFHSVPTDASGQYIPAEAAKLGKMPASHGCVRLSVADAQWVFTHAKVGMVVKVY